MYSSGVQEAWPPTPYFNPENVETCREISAICNLPEAILPDIFNEKLHDSFFLVCEINIVARAFA